MGWFGAMYILEEVDKRVPGSLKHLRRYIFWEAEPARTLEVAIKEFEAAHGRKPRYLKGANHAND